MPTPSITELRILECAVRTGSLSRAARELGITQQGVSSRLRGFERRLGLELVHRSHSGVKPTETGEIVLVRGREVLAAAARLDEAIAGIGGPGGERISVGASQTIASHLLPAWLLRLRRSEAAEGRPVTAVELRTENSETVISLLRAGALDLGFIETPVRPRGLGAAALRRDEMVLAVAPDHPWADRRSVALEEVAELPLVAREPGSGTRAAFELAVSSALHRTAADPLVVLGTEAAVRSAVAHGVAPAVLSELTVQDDVRLGRIRALAFAPRPVTRPLTAIWRGSQRDLTGARRSLVSLAAQG